jgi:Zn-finger nucleic acid-binding protein
MREELCGRCGGGLEGGDFGGVQFKRCLGCQGLLVEQPVFVRLLDRLTETLGEHIGVDGPIPPVLSDVKPVPCPACSSVMERFGYMETRTVFLDRCRTCKLLWVDREELQTAVMMHARTTHRADAQKTALIELTEHLSRIVIRGVKGRW